MTATAGTLPNVRERVILTVRSGELHTLQVSARVDSVGADGRLGLRVHSNLERFRIRPGVPLALDCPRGEAVWRMLSRVEEVVPQTTGSHDAPLLWCSPPFDHRRVDGRRFLRLHVWLPVRFVLVSIPPDYEHLQPQERVDLHAQWAESLHHADRNGRVFSIGAGGLAMVPQGPLHDGDEVFLEFAEQGALPAQLAARVIWGEHHDDPTAGAPMQAGLSFVGISDDEQDRILDLVVRVKQQRRQH